MPTVTSRVYIGLSHVIRQWTWFAKTKSAFNSFLSFAEDIWVFAQYAKSTSTNSTSRRQW
jgi:hypothetical protein